jgi:hypothetical protein
MRFAVADGKIDPSDRHGPKPINMNFIQTLSDTKVISSTRHCAASALSFQIVNDDIVKTQPSRSLSSALNLMTFHILIVNVFNRNMFTISSRPITSRWALTEAE